MFSRLRIGCNLIREYCIVVELNYVRLDENLRDYRIILTLRFGKLLIVIMGTHELILYLTQVSPFWLTSSYNVVHAFKTKIDFKVFIMTNLIKVFVEIPNTKSAK